MRRRPICLLGAHLLTPEEALIVPAGSVVYNLEQLGGPSLPKHFYEAWHPPSGMGLQLEQPENVGGHEVCAVPRSMFRWDMYQN